jgi:hypothetical protein
MCFSTPAAFGYTWHVRRRLSGGFSRIAFSLATLAAAALTMQIAAAFLLH